MGTSGGGKLTIEQAIGATQDRVAGWSRRLDAGQSLDGQAIRSGLAEELEDLWFELEAFRRQVVPLVERAAVDSREVSNRGRATILVVATQVLEYFQRLGQLIGQVDQLLGRLGVDPLVELGAVIKAVVDQIPAAETSEEF